MSKVVVDGLREFQGDLRRADRELAKQLQRAHKAIAEGVATKAQARARSVSAQYAKAAPGIRPRATQRAGKIALLGGKYPWIFGAEFGSRRFRQFPPWRGNQWTAGVGPGEGVGYAVHPTIRDEAQNIVDGYADHLDDALRVAYPKGR